MTFPCRRPVFPVLDAPRRSEKSSKGRVHRELLLLHISSNDAPSTGQIAREYRLIQFGVADYDFPICAAITGRPSAFSRLIMSLRASR